MASVSLWPSDIRVEHPPRGMRQMLVDAGADLAVLTSHRLRFVVDTDGQPTTDDSSGPEVEFVHRCAIHARGLSVAITLLTVTHKAQPFPAYVAAADGQTFAVTTEDQLREVLAKIFHSPRTRDLMTSLLANID